MMYLRAILRHIGTSIKETTHNIAIKNTFYNNHEQSIRTYDVTLHQNYETKRSLTQLEQLELHFEPSSSVA